MIDVSSVIPIACIDINKKPKFNVKRFSMKNLNAKALEEFHSLLRSHLRRPNSR